MLARHFRKIGLPLLMVAACRASDRSNASDTTRSLAGADSAPATTYEMLQALTRDVHESDRELAAVEDSIYLFMGDSVTAIMKRARGSWEEFRKLECDAIRVAYAEGSMASVAQMECWIGLTDDHRRFLAEQFDYMRNKRMRARAPRGP